MKLELNPKEMCKRVIKYVLAGLVVAFAALVLPQKSMAVEDVVGLALVAAATFAVLELLVTDDDRFGVNKIAETAKMGAGFGIGANLVGFAK